MTNYITLVAFNEVSMFVGRGLICDGRNWIEKNIAGVNSELAMKVRNYAEDIYLCWLGMRDPAAVAIQYGVSRKRVLANMKGEIYNVYKF